ncbi:MAG: class I SAM-dependent methyltransferase [Anaerolineae bacterium]|nr:class I SAM-dependent methyltransferase [Anaerolineae bacterium]
MSEPIEALLERCLDPRLPLLEAPHQSAACLFNGFSEGLPGLVVEVYATTLVIANHAEVDAVLPETLERVAAFFRVRLPWLTAALLKSRRSAIPDERLGRLLWGTSPARKVREHGVGYALNLTLNQDTSLYLDTRGLRAWLKENCAGLSVLNTFAYTGSLGAACAAGGAQRVLQIDLDKRFLNLGKDTYALNGWPVRRADFLADDVFRLAGLMRRKGEKFDLVILDPPFFSSTTAGRVDLVNEPVSLINKLRPLVRDGGRMVVVNNALFTSGADFLGAIRDLPGSQFIETEALIPVPEDVTGYAQTRCLPPPSSPAPFNHTTKIAVLRIHHPD